MWHSWEVVRGKEKVCVRCYVLLVVSHFLLFLSDICRVIVLYIIDFDLYYYFLCHCFFFFFSFSNLRDGWPGFHMSYRPSLLPCPVFRASSRHGAPGRLAHTSVPAEPNRRRRFLTCSPKKGWTRGDIPYFRSNISLPLSRFVICFIYFPFFWGEGVLFLFNMFIFSLQCCLDDECFHVANSVDAKASDGAHRRPLIFSWQDGGRRYSSATVSARSWPLHVERSK